MRRKSPEVRADGGVFSVLNLKEPEKWSIEGVLPDAPLRGDLRQRRGPLKMAGDSPAHCRMRIKPRGPAGQARYQRWQSSVEPVFGVLKEQLSMRRLRTPGLSKAGTEVAL